MSTSGRVAPDQVPAKPSRASRTPASLTISYLEVGTLDKLSRLQQFLQVCSPQVSQCRLFTSFSEAAVLELAGMPVAGPVDSQVSPTSALLSLIKLCWSGMQLLMLSLRGAGAQARQGHRLPAHLCLGGLLRSCRAAAAAAAGAAARGCRVQPARAHEAEGARGQAGGLHCGQYW